MAASLVAASWCVFFMKGVIPLGKLWSSTSIAVGWPIRDTTRCVWSVWRGRRRSRRASSRWSAGGQRFYVAGRGWASSRCWWKGFLSAVRGWGRCKRCFLAWGRWGISTATSVKGWWRRWCRGAVLHPTATAGGVGYVRQRGAVWAWMFWWRGLVGGWRWGGPACGRTRSCWPGPRGA